MATSGAVLAVTTSTRLSLLSLAHIRIVLAYGAISVGGHMVMRLGVHIMILPLAAREGGHRVRMLRAARFRHLSLTHKKTTCVVFGDLLVYDSAILSKHRACAYEIPPDVHSQIAAFAFRTCRLQSDYQ